MHLPEEGPRNVRVRLNFLSGYEQDMITGKELWLLFMNGENLLIIVKKKIIFICSPFSILATKYLNRLSPAWKIASGEFNNKLLLKNISLISKNL